MAGLQPDVLHAYHAFKSGVVATAALDLMDPARRPALVVSLSGTDINRDLDDPDRTTAVTSVLQRAEGLAATSASILRVLESHHPRLAARTRVIPKGVGLPTGRPDRAAFRTRYQIAEHEILFLHPAGIRPVKGQLRVVEPFCRLRKEGLPVRLVMLGPELDSRYATELRAAVADSNGVILWPGTLAPGQMTDAYAACDVVLNSSHSEGLPNVLLEAMAMRRPLLVSTIPGNLTVVEPGHTGLTFHDTPELLRHARLLASDPELRKRLGANGRQQVLARHRPEQEASAMRAVYTQALGQAQESGALDSQRPG